MGYPTNIDAFRIIENLPGVTYDVLNKKTLFVEDITNTQSSIVTIETELGLSPSGASATVAARLDDIDAIIAAIKPALYPVGSIYSNASDATNPATLLGFGTWEAMQNRVLVGKGSGTFAANGATGGAETHALSIPELANHNHVGLYGNGDGNFQVGMGGVGASPSRAVAYQVALQNLYSITTGYTGAGNPHNNLQPYIVVYMWKRTA